MNIFCVLADAGDWWSCVGVPICIGVIVFIWKGLPELEKQMHERKKAEESRKNAEETRKKAEETRAEAHKRVQDLMTRKDMTASICSKCKGMGKIQSGQDKQWNDCPDCGGIGYTYKKNNP